MNTPNPDAPRRRLQQLTGQVLSQVPALARAWGRSFPALRFDSVPFAPLAKPLPDCRIAIVTTGGVHRRDQPPFDMSDSRGDASYRRIPADTPDSELTITHDYYNHSDVLRDFNILFPRALLGKLAQRGIIAELAACFSFMGHIEPPHLDTLVGQTAPAVVEQLKQEQVDAVLLTPA